MKKLFKIKRVGPALIVGTLLSLWMFYTYFAHGAKMLDAPAFQIVSFVGGLLFIMGLFQFYVDNIAVDSLESNKSSDPKIG